MYKSKYTGKEVDERLGKVDYIITAAPEKGEQAEIKALNQGDKTIYPVTSVKAIVDENGNRVTLATTDDIQAAIQESITDVIHSDL